MRFYRDIINSKLYFYYIKFSKLTCIHFDEQNKAIVFYKNGNYHNTKNAAYICFNRYKSFSLNNKCYGYEDNFTKLSWRKFTKLQAFL
jgi:hypothetical protein